ncbi:MAG: hypothetical protein K9W44_07370 [Candidatus Lokiarchaeota archaeon]|nr:hypothetical protein [Candidatus Harpocratesius repetitus]
MEDPSIPNQKNKEIEDDKKENESNSVENKEIDNMSAPNQEDNTISNLTNKNLKEELLNFSELEQDEFTEQDLEDMEAAIAENLMDIEDIESEFEEETEPLENNQIEFQPEIDADLEARMEEEIQKKRKEMGIKTVSKEQFINNLSKRRNKIIYHALWHLVFNIEDHQASKQTLYEALKEVTSKNPVEPIEEHKFYFGLGFILRLQLYDEKVVQFKDGKLVLAINPDHMKEILNIVGDPISERPILTKSEKTKMFQDFLKDDFLDI